MVRALLALLLVGGLLATSGCAKCGPSNCTGCCDASGQCQAAAPEHCGQNGAACSACAPFQTCLIGACTFTGGNGSGNGSSSSGSASTSASQGSVASSAASSGASGTSGGASSGSIGTSGGASTGTSATSASVATTSASSSASTTSATATSGTSGSSGAGTTGGAPASHFSATPQDWTLPAGGLANRGFVQTTYGSYYSTTQGEPSWALVDLDGDGKLDLVVTSENVIPDGSYYDSQVFDVGSAPHWQLYRNTGAGFAAQASNWAVPVGGLPNRGFVQTTYGSFYSTSQGEQSWTLVDVDGDRKPDLVVTSENTVADGSYFDSQVFGGTTGAHWQVYLNTGSGFAAQATNWTVPTGGLPNRGFVQTNYGSYYSTSQGEQSWSLVDLDLDGKPDLVATSENVIADGSYFDSQVFGGSASPHWQFYRNTGSGFATQAVDWPLPSGGLPGRGFVQTGYGTFYSTTQGEQSWALTDLDGDRRPDLVVTSENAIPNGSYYNSQVFDVGSAPHWQVYRNTGSGFAAQAASWTVPVGGLPNRGFVQTTYGSFYSTDQNEQSWALVDLDHDGLADLVATSEDVIADGSYFDSLVMGGTSSAHWALYRNTGAGFAVRSQDWTVPAGGLPNRGFVQTTYGSFYSTAQSEQSWALIDLDADAVLDLVVTSENVVQDGSYFDSQVFGGVGAPHWLVYRGQ